MTWVPPPLAPQKADSQSKATQNCTTAMPTTSTTTTTTTTTGGSLRRLLDATVNVLCDAIIIVFTFPLWLDVLMLPEYRFVFASGLSVRSLLSAIAIGRICRLGPGLLQPLLRLALIALLSLDRSEVTMEQEAHHLTLLCVLVLPLLYRFYRSLILGVRSGRRRRRRRGPNPEKGTPGSASRWYLTTAALVLGGVRHLCHRSSALPPLRFFLLAAAVFLTPPLAGVGSHGEERARFRAELFPARKGGGGAAIPPGPTPGGEGGGAGADAARRAEDAERALKWADERRTRKAARKGDVRAPEAATAPSQ